MAKPSVSQTALGAATCRLIEQYQPEPTRLFTDPVVNALVGARIRFLTQSAWMRNLDIESQGQDLPPPGEGNFNIGE